MATNFDQATFRHEPPPPVENKMIVLCDLCDARVYGEVQAIRQSGWVVNSREALCPKDREEI